MKRKNQLSKKEYEDLESWRDPDSWKELDPDEKQVLASLFNRQGMELVEKGDEQALESFKKASKLAPKNYQIHFQQALSLAKRTESRTSLRQSIKAVKKLIKLDPDSFDAWLLWAQVLLGIGLLAHETDPLEEALEKFQMAESLSHKASSIKLGNFYRNWGLCCYHIGKLSGEACDFQLAVEKYAQASQLGKQTPELWNDYGNALTELGILVRNKQFCLDAVEMYRQAAESDFDFFAAWLNLASGLEFLFASVKDRQMFEQSDKAFHRAAQLNPEVAPLWLLWARLLRNYGKVYSDPEKLRESVEKLEVADMLDRDNPAILANWADTYLQLGVFEEDLQYFHKAEEKIQASLKRERHDPHVWCLYGHYFMELGRYYSDSAYYEKAIEQFRKGTSLDEKNPELWYGLAIAQCAVGLVDANDTLLKLSVQYFQHAVEIGNIGSPQFWNDYGLCFFHLAEITQEKHYLESALDRFEQAVVLDSQENSSERLHPEYLYNLGCAVDFLGDFEEEPRCYEHSIQIFLKILKLDPEFDRVHYRLGVALTHYAELTSDSAALSKAIEHFEYRHEQDPEDDANLVEWGIALIQYAHLTQSPTQSEESHAYYEQAEQRFMLALSLGNNEAHYHLACLYSLSGKYQIALHHLDRARKAGELPPVDELLEDDWLEGLRQTARFRQFLEHHLKPKW